MAGNGRVSGIFRQPQPAFDAAGFGAADITSYIFNIRIVERFDHDFVVRPQQFKHRINGTHLLRLCASHGCANQTE
ncbi:Uncharacterised protein [Acinetobacter baumannii]|nr:Uncharacterised protein [Acinetobacter baumannii]